MRKSTACWNSWSRARVMPSPAARRPSRYSSARSTASGWLTDDWASSWCGMASFRTLDWFSFWLIPSCRRSSTRAECRSSAKPSAAGNSIRKWTRSFSRKCRWVSPKRFRTRPVKRRSPLSVLNWRERPFSEGKCALPPEWRWICRKPATSSAERSW